MFLSDVHHIYLDDYLMCTYWESHLIIFKQWVRQGVQEFAFLRSPQALSCQGLVVVTRSVCYGLPVRCPPRAQCVNTRSSADGVIWGEVVNFQEVEFSQRKWAISGSEGHALKLKPDPTSCPSLLCYYVTYVHCHEQELICPTCLLCPQWTILSVSL